MKSDLFPPGEHHAFMIQALERVERGEIKRLMVLPEAIEQLQ